MSNQLNESRQRHHTKQPQQQQSKGWCEVLQNIHPLHHSFGLRSVHCNFGRDCVVSVVRGVSQPKDLRWCAETESDIAHVLSKRMVTHALYTVGAPNGAGISSHQVVTTRNGRPQTHAPSVTLSVP